VAGGACSPHPHCHASPAVCCFRRSSAAVALGFPKTYPPNHGFSLSKQKADNASEDGVENRADHHAAHSAEQHEDVGLTKQHPDRQNPMKALRMQVTEKPQESQMSPLSPMFAALLLRADCRNFCTGVVVNRRMAA